MERPTIVLDSADRYNKIYGLPTAHPLVSVVDLNHATSGINHARVHYGMYALFLKQGVQCTLRYGRRKYDYQEGTVVSFAPGQIVDVDHDNATTAMDVVGVLFHPDLIYGTPLGKRIRDFAFFDYSQNEAVHLSEDERAVFLDCLDKIKRELDHPVDGHSASLLSATIQVLLEYMHRFYDRQFITRHKANSDVVAAFEKRLKEFFDNGTASEEGMPSVAYFADLAHLSAGYFGDLIKKETGRTPKELIKQHLVDAAKQRLAASDEDIALIAYDMGFQYPAHFTRLFKRVTGVSPRSYREGLDRSLLN